MQSPNVWSLHASYPGGFEAIIAWILLPFSGDVLLPAGDLSGGSMGGAGAGLLAKRREIEELRLEVTELEGDSALKILKG